MQIHPYLTVIQGEKSYTARRPARSESDRLFQVEADAGPERARDVVEVISLENRRAVAQAPPKDLLAAEKILTRVKENLDGLSRSDLRQVHRLDGLVHVFRS